MRDDAFDDVMAALDAPMAVVTAVAGDERAGCLVGFHAQASIDPPEYSVWLSKANHTYRVALLGTYLGVHLLAEADRALAEHFGTLTGDETDKFAGLDVEYGPEGLPMLTACGHRMVVRRTVLLDAGGDHVCMVTEPVDVTVGDAFRPLRLAAVDDLHPGHDTHDRPRPPTERAGEE